MTESEVKSFAWNQAQAEVTVKAGGEAVQLLNAIRDMTSQMKASGMSDKEILSALQESLYTEGGRLNNISKASLKRMNVFTLNKSSLLGAFYVQNRKYKGQTRLKWVIESRNPCKDCFKREGQVKTFAVWVSMGIPKSGFSDCGYYCKCDLVIPESSDITNLNLGGEKRV